MRNVLVQPTTTVSRPLPLWRRRRWLIGSIAAIGLLFLVSVGLMLWRMSYVPTGLDDSTTRLSEQGLFQTTYTSGSTPIPINQLHTWTLHVETAEGEPVENAEILVDGDMPQHGHGLPTQPVVTQYLGNGDYLVEGMKFQMSGWWVMDFTIRTDAGTDVVHFNVVLD